MRLTTLTSILAIKHKVFRAMMLLSAMLLLPSALFAQGKNAYALWTEGNSTLTFLYTDNVYEVGKSLSGNTITKLWSGDDVLNSPAGDVPGWTSIRKKVQVVEIDQSFADARPKSIAYWFDNSENGTTPASTLTTIKGLEYLNTSEVTSMCGAFFRCAVFGDLDLSTFKTSKVTDMSYMFMGCTGLKQLDLSGFNTGSVTNMSNMFAYCSALTAVDVAGFDTQNVTDLSSMFYGCKALADVDVSGFNTKSATTFANMFYGCSAITEIDLSNFVVDNVTTTANMFASCSSLATIRAAENADWRGVSNTSNMFAGCNKLLAVSKDGSNCKYVAGEDMPYACANGKGYFTSIAGYMITFVGYTSSDVVLQMVDKDAATVQLKQNTFTDPNDYKVFGSWNTEKDGSGTSYNDGETISITGNMILYSQWGMDISLCDITVNPLSYTYNGKECTPSIIIEDNLDALTLDKDYKVEYKDNVNSGTATAIVRGIKNYAGTVNKTFAIKPANISVATITPQRQVLAYSGEAQAPTYVLRNGDVRLEEGVDYTISGLDGNSAVDDYTVKFTGKGNYTGTTTAIYTISAQKAYAVWTEGNATLTFMMAETAPVVGEDFNGSPVTAFWTGDDVLNSPKSSVPAWNSTVSGTVKIVNFDASFAEASPKSIAYWFDNTIEPGSPAQTLVQIKNIKNLNTSAVTSMQGAFSGCSALTLIDVSKFNTDLVTDMSCMFFECSKATKIDVSGFYTESCTDMSNMFYGCSKLTKIATDNFDTKNVTSMSGMFEYCSSLTEAAVSGFNTENVTDMESMFSSCTALKTVDLSKFNTAKVTKMNDMFWGCSSLTELNVASFETSNVESFAFMFCGCSKLASLDVSKFNTSSATNFAAMFMDCESLTSLNVSGFATNKATNFSDMFGGCKNLAKIDVSKFETGKAIHFSSMFNGCASLKELYVGNFDMSSAYDMHKMFAGCSSLVTIRAKQDTDWTSVDNADDVFAGDNALVGVGADGTVCTYEDGKNAPNVCKDKIGYFTPDNIYVITFDNNLDDREYAYQVVIRPVLDKVQLMPNPFTSDTYNFVSWNTSADGTGTTSKDEASINVGSDITLYAQWGRDIELCKDNSSITPNSYTYTGENLRVTDHGGRIIIKDGDKTLLVNVDYTITYPAEFTNVGTYDVTITGKGIYAGSFTLSYEIAPYDLSDVNIEPENAVFVYNGEAQCPDFVLTDGNGNKLTKDVDYNIITDVSANINGEEYMVELEGIGNYTGFNYAFYSIKSAYAVWTETNNTLTFVLDENIYKAGVSYIDGHKATKVWSGDAIAKSPVDGKPAWGEILGSLVTVNFKENFANVSPTSTAYWFAGADKLATIINPDKLNTSDVTSMASMFEGCKSLTAIDLSNFNTSNVTDMSKMFYGCASLEEMNVRSFNTAKVTKMDGMFANCTALHTILANATDNWAKTNPSMSGMFAGDKALVGIGTDNTFCEYADGADYPNVCRDSKGYFTADNIHIITFNDNNSGTLAYQSVSSVSSTPTKLNANAFNYTGHYFVKWTTEPDGTGTAYDDEEEVRFYENTTLYAMWKKDIAACTYAFDPESSTFTGEEITPKLILTDGDYTLKETIDYVLEGYSNNIHAGNATAAVRGRGEYAGKATFGFYIAPRNLKEVAVAVKSASTSLEYNKEAQAPEYALVYGAIQLVEGTDYTMSSIENNIDVDQYTVTFTGKGDYTGETTSSYKITPRDITIATVEAIADQEYSGTAIEPAISVKDGSDALTAEKDYTVIFTNNVNAGTANVKVNGTGNYKNSIETATFKIVPLALSKVTIEPKNAELPYNRGPQNPEYVLTVNGITLTPNTDYTISGDLAKTDVAEGYTVKFTAVEPGNFTGETTAKYAITKLSLENYAEIVFEGGKTNFKVTGELIKPVVSIVDEYGNTLVENTDYTLTNPGNKEIGSYDIKVSGIGNYTGTITANYRIVDKSLEDATVEITDGPFTYDGTEKKPSIKVLNGETELVAGTDFTIEYNNNINASDKAEVILNGIGKYEYSNKIEYFTIAPRSMDNVVAVQADDNELVYNGEAQIAKFALKDGDITLTEDDYTTGDYSKNIEAGIYVIAFTGKGNYTGVVNGNYEIRGCNIEDATVTTDELEKVYTGEAQTVTLTVKIGETQLVFGKDYSVSYEDALNVGTATATVEGIGNYAGFSKNKVQFKIVPMPIANVTFEPKNGKWSVGYTGEPVFPVVVAKDKYGNTLEEGKDYTAGGYDNNIEVADGYEVTFTGKGNYTGTYTAAYKITERSIEDAEIIFKDGVEEYTYTGAEIKPVEKIIDLGKDLVEGVDYILSYSSNKEPGTAVITVTGRGKYQGGRKIANFTIKKIEMSDVEITLSADKFEYNKAAQAPTFTLKDKNGYTLVSGTDFTMTGAEGNVNADEYTVTFTAVEDGHYNGEATAKYVITPVNVDVTKVAISFSDNEFTYNAQPQLPTITVTYKGEALASGVDYEIEYGDNVNAGDVYVDVIGKNNYAGFQVRSDKFVIKPAPLADNMVQLAEGSTNQFVYNRHAQAPVLVVKGVDGNALTSGTDFDASTTAYNVDANDYSITFTGKGNYTGTAKFDYAIKPYDISGDKSVVAFKDGISEFDYDGSEITPEFTVSADGQALVIDTEYAVSGETTGKNAKKYTIVVTGKGNFTGVKEADFRILPKNISGTATVEFYDGNKYIETGSEIKPAVYVNDGTANLEETDYEVAYSNNINPGTGIAEVTGIGNYEGFKMSKEFTILPKKPVITFNVKDNDELEYGVAKIGEGILATVDETYKGSITYNYADGELLKPTKQGEKYTIVVTYNPDNFTTESEAQVSISVKGRELEVVGVEVETTKTYDGKKTAAVKQPTAIKNVVDGDQVTVTATAEYATQKPGKQKITISYTLSGDDAYKYVAENTIIDGEILKEDIKATAEWTLDPQTAIAYKDSEQNDYKHFCAGDKISVKFNESKGMPMTYTVKFDRQEQIGDYEPVPAITNDYPGDGETIDIVIPEDLKYGKYAVNVTLENSDAETQSEAFSETIYVDGSVSGENAIVKTKWDDVIYVANPQNEFVKYTWYREDYQDSLQTLDAPGQYYQEKSGLLSTVYGVRIDRVDGGVVYSCPFVPTASVKKSVEVASVNVYPNPAVANQDFTVEIKDVENLDGNITIVIYNANGVMVRRIDHASSISQISLPAGQYTGVAVADGKKLTFRVIVQ
ncbi:MAG: BspA family leucine-rich repeat surface protein [Bacteroidales bacterium]|nr:BspA family leucine-rich repeat surface protein [Bacteroidales bacterium]